jgi:hypothetical protein
VVLEAEGRAAEAEAVETDQDLAEAEGPDQDCLERWRRLDSWRSQHSKSLRDNEASVVP